MARAVQTFSPVNPVGVSRFRVRTFRHLLPGTLVLCAAVAASTWLLATVGCMQTVATSLSPHSGGRLDVSLGVRPVARAAAPQRIIHVTKFSRLGEPSESQIRLASLTPDAIRSFQEKLAAKRVKPPAAAFARQTASLAFSRSVPEQAEIALSGRPSAMASALVEPRAARDDLQKPFSLVLADPQSSPVAHALPDTGPTPLSRPAAGLADAVRRSSPARVKREGETELAYAPVDRPELDDGITRFANPARARTAVYDIEAGMVYLPSGERLEAHSGIGKMRDNPKYVHVRMRGATPPSTYRLTMREALFHGVEALRLTPVNGIKPHGRDGLLAHTYMLARRGESNGCVVFKEYHRFLKAFKRGEINRIVVVPRLPSSPSQVASLVSSGA